MCFISRQSITRSLMTCTRAGIKNDFRQHNRYFQDRRHDWSKASLASQYRKGPLPSARPVQNASSIYKTIFLNLQSQLPRLLSRADQRKRDETSPKQNDAKVKRNEVQGNKTRTFTYHSCI